MSNAALLGTLFITALSSLFTFSSAVHHLYQLGKSRTKLKKERKNGSLWDKFTLRFYLAGCEYHRATARRLRLAYQLYWGVVALCLLVWGLTFAFPLLHPVFEVLVLGKAFLLDLPILIYEMAMTRHVKYNRRFSRWVWDADKEAKP